MKKDEGFYFLQPEDIEHFEKMLYVKGFLSRYGAWLYLMGDKKNEKGETLLVPLLDSFKAIKKGGKYYLKLKMKAESGKVLIKVFGPISKNTVEDIFIPLRDYQNQKTKKAQLTTLLVPILKNQKGEVTEVFEDYKETRCKKIEAIKAQSYEDASQYRDEEVRFLKEIKKIASSLREIINEKCGFKWVTEHHIIDVINDLY